MRLMTSRSVLAALVLFALPARAQEAASAVLTGVGFAPISSQPAKTDEERRLLAIRASHLAALRNLAEQVYGVKLQSQSSAANTSLQSDSIRATVSGTVAGARIVKITPKGDDTYETIVEMRRPAGGAD